MLQPFDHVLISSMEFVLCRRNTAKSMLDDGKDEWHAKDESGNSVVLSDRCMKKLLPQAYNKDILIYEPVFYRERGNQRIRIEILDMLSQINSGEVSGTSVDAKYTRWQWNIQDFTIKNTNETWLLRVFTPGGWWL